VQWSWVVTAQKPDVKQHAPRAGCGQGFGEHTEPSVRYVPCSAVHRALVVTAQKPDEKQQAPVGGGGGQPPVAVQALLLPW
jgi:hypothetical protein